MAGSIPVRHPKNQGYRTLRELPFDGTILLCHVPMSRLGQATRRHSYRRARQERYLQPVLFLIFVCIAGDRDPVRYGEVPRKDPANVGAAPITKSHLMRDRLESPATVS